MRVIPIAHGRIIMPTNNSRRAIMAIGLAAGIDPITANEISCDITITWRAARRIHSGDHGLQVPRLPTAYPMTSRLGLIACTLALGAFAQGSAAAQLPRDSVVQIVAPPGVLVGSLLVPARSAPRPVVLIIAGSGPTDRNGNSRGLPGKNNSLQDLAQALCDSGIASLRYDKRGVGASAAGVHSDADVTFDTEVSDAARWIPRLRADHRFSTITVIGHSEGSLIGMLAARTGGADGFVSIAGAGRPAADVIRGQVRPLLHQHCSLHSIR